MDDTMLLEKRFSLDVALALGSAVPNPDTRSYSGSQAAGSTSKDTGSSSAQSRIKPIVTAFGKRSTSTRESSQSSSIDTEAETTSSSDTNANKSPSMTSSTATKSTTSTTTSRSSSVKTSSTTEEHPTITITRSTLKTSTTTDEDTSTSVNLLPPTSRTADFTSTDHDSVTSSSSSSSSSSSTATDSSIPTTLISTSLSSSTTQTGNITSIASALPTTPTSPSLPPSGSSEPKQCQPGTSCASIVGVSTGVGGFVILAVLFFLCRKYRRYLTASQKSHHDHRDSRQEQMGSSSIGEYTSSIKLENAVPIPAYSRPPLCSPAPQYGGRDELFLPEDVQRVVDRVEVMRNEPTRLPKEKYGSVIRKPLGTYRDF